MLSTWLSTWTEISVDAEGNPISVELSAELSSLVDVIYDGFVPQILAISAGFYPVPYAEPDMLEYTDKADMYPVQHPFVDRLIWKIDEASDMEFPYNVAQHNRNTYPE